ncbi:MAG: hypothetical protein D8M58_05575 [Calditrichaeota bacterium]|nr:MAG: hypothetical protein DWQ03_20930 [Calditrichota bacterium]MBL1204846.1 hypothetical protein [Calditrichota bacterium]NOG44675.1 hypothetical protein [Calditrichota bacterium]
MKRCPITYQKLDSTKYSAKGLRSFSNKISDLEKINIDFSNGSSYSLNPHSRENFGKLQVKNKCFVKGDKNDRYVFVQDNDPESQYIFNRDLTLKLATLSGIKTVTHGLAYLQSGNLVFWYKRPQFFGRSIQYQIDTFDELIPEDEANVFRHLIEILNSTCTFPALEKLNLLRLILFSFLTGHDSIATSSLSLIHNKERVELTPQCCLVNNHIYQSKKKAESISFLGEEVLLGNTDKALCFANEVLGVNPKAFSQVMQELNVVYLKWLKTIEVSFIKNPIKKEYLELLRNRRRLFFKY